MRRQPAKYFRRLSRLHFVKRDDGSSVGSLQIKDWTLWGGRPLPKRKKKLKGRAGAGNVEAPATNNTKRKWPKFIRVPLGTSAQKEGVVAMVGEWLPQQKEGTPRPKPKKEDVASAALGRKERFRKALRMEQCGVPLKG
jgi:hypothetical protein